MKTIIKSLFAVLVLGLCVEVQAQSVVQAFGRGATGTVAATVFVPEGNDSASFTKLTEINVAANDTNTFCYVFEGLRQGKVTTASASGTNILTTFTNGFGWGDYVIVRNSTNGLGGGLKPQYQLKQIISVSSTNIGLADSFSTALAVGDPFWVCAKPYERRLLTQMDGNCAASNTFWRAASCEVYLTGPGSYPSANMATNATASQIRLNVSGVKIKTAD